MTCFEAGFVKYAQEYGLSEEEAARILKRALEYPAAHDMFKSLPEEGEDAQHTPDTLEALSEMLNQEKIDQEMRRMHHVNL